MSSSSSQPLHLVLIGYNRPASMSRLVTSISKADYGVAPAPM